MLKKKALHYLLLLSFVVLGFTANANTYYISNDGNDSNSGTDASSPWQTLNKLNSVSLSAGDNILFRRGDTFYGKIILNIQSASSSTPITYGAYGSGNKPIITGFTSVTSWTNKGGNIWESTNAVSTLTTMAQVVINGQSVPMGKFPNEDVTYPYLPNFYKFQSFTGTGSGASSITSSSLTDGNNWSGADLVIRVNQWTFDKTKITSQSGTTLNFNGVASTGETLAANWGFFIQNDIRTLDQQNEWYYNPSTKKIDIYSTTQPTNVQVSTVDTLLYNYSNIPQVTSISVDNIQFTGANGNAIWISGNLTFSVTNCDISYSGLEGIILYGGGIQNGTISNNNIHDNASSGIYETGDVSNLTITNNTINTSGIVSIYKTNDYGNGGMTIEAPNSLIQYNTIDSSAYCGIVFASSNFQVRNNFINHSSLVRGDAAGIYTGFANETGKIIDGNIVLNSEGNPRGAGSDDYFAMGIYCDDLGTGVQITNNTIGYARTAGIYLHNSNNLVVRNNTIFSCGALGTEVMWANGGISMDGNAGTNEIGAVYGNTVANNKVFATNQYQFDINYYDQAGSNNGPNNFGVIDSNYYVKVNSAATAIKAQLDGVSYDNMSLSGWQSLTRKDLHSHESPVVITDPINLRFEYNYSSASKVVSLDQKYIDVTGTQYNSGSITLAPYSSAVLIKNGAFISLTTHYISTTGNDETGDGTSGNPWATLVKACSSVTRAGDTIYVNPGTYVETNPAILAAGVSIKGAGTSSHIISHYKADWNYSNPTKASIVLSSDTEGTNGNQSISNILLDGDNLTANLGILVRLRSNVKIHDMSIKDFYINGINYLGSSVNSESKPTTYSTANELYNVIIDNCTDSANTWVGGGLINVCGQKDLSIHDCTFSDTARVAGANGNIVMNNRFGLGFKYYNNTSYKPSMGNDGWNFYLEIPWGSGGTEIYNNRFYGGEQGIDIGSFAEYNYSYSFSYDIHDNYFEDTNPTATGSNGKTALYVEGARAVNVFMHNNTFKNISQPFSVIDGSTPGIAPNDTNIVFRNNICMNMGMDAPDNWQALIEINKSVGSIYGLYIINNTIVPNTVINSSAISISNHGSSMKNIVIGNNIITNSKNGYWMFVDNTNSTLDSLVIRNNILYNNANNNAITFSGNAVTNYINQGNINSNPLFVSATDLSLQASSPAIGAAYSYGYGTDIGGFPYVGNNMHYISQFGNDATGTGTIGNPWATLAKACSSVTTAGDTIYVNPGTYVETNPAILAAGVSIKGAGTSSHIISHYKADWNYSNPTKASIVLSSSTEGTNGNQSISHILLDGDNLTANLGILVRLRSNVKIHDMSIKDFYINGINYLGSSVNSESKPTTYSTANELYNVIIDNCTDSANTWVGGGLINVCGQKDLSIHDCTFSDTARVAGANGNIVMNNRFGLGFKYYNNTSYKPSMGNDGWNFYLEIPWGSGGTEIYNNRFYGGEQGIDIGSFAEYNYSYSFSYDIHDNYFEDTNPTATGSNGKTALYVEGARAVNVFMHNNTFKNISQPFSVIDGSTPGIAPNDTNIVFRNNICMNMGMDAPDNWQALIEINKSVGSIYGLYIINNTIVPNTVINSSAISISNHGSSMKNIVIGNNIITNSKNGYWMFVDNTNSTLDSLVIRNNILYNNANNNAITFSGNAVTNYINQGNINSNPLFVSATDLSLQATSPAIGAAYSYGYGTDIGGFPYVGNNMHYISPFGNDATGTGTIGNPWATLVKACSSVTTAGDTIYVNPGTYIETLPAMVAVGVNIKGADSATTIIKSHYVADWNQNNPSAAAISFVSGTEGTNGNQSLSGITLDGDNLTGTLGITIRARGGVIIHNIKIKDFFINGLSIFGSIANPYTKPSFYADGIQLYNITVTNCTDTAETYVGGGNMNISGFKNLTIHDFILADTSRGEGANGDNIVAGYYGVGAHIYNGTSYKPSTPNAGWNFHFEIPNWEGGVEIDHVNFYGGDCAVDVGLNHGYDEVNYPLSFNIHNCYFEDTNPNSNGTHGKTAISMEGPLVKNVNIGYNTFKNTVQPFGITDGTSPGVATHDTNIVFRNNICMNMGVTAVPYWQNLVEINKSEAGGSIYGLYIINNTFVPNSTVNSTVFSITNLNGATSKNIVIANNIIVRSNNGTWLRVDNTGSTLDSLIVRNNLFYNNYTDIPTFSGNAVTNYISTGSFDGDPLFTSPPYDLSLQATSPAIGAAYNYGYGTDIGAIPYEGSLSVTGFNYDVIVDNVLNGTVSNLRNHDMDGWGYSFYASGFSSGSTPSQNGLPADGKILSRTGTTYQFQPWNQNNALWLNAGDTGTITLTSPHKFEKIKIALTNANGPSTVAYKVNYSDGSSDNGSFNINDWACYSCTDYAINQLGRVDGSGTLQSPVFAIYEDSIITNASKTINSIHFAPSGGTVSIFALSSAQVADTNVHELRTSHLKSVEKDEELNYMPYAEKVEINPNPFSEKLYLKIESPIQDKAVIIITDLSGRQLYKENISIGIGNNFYEINKAAGFSNGIYFISVFSTAQKKTVKVIKTGAGN
jgi:parallel beta-helix repeat protein